MAAEPAAPFDRAVWSLEMVMAWIATGDRFAVDSAARHVERGGRASSINLLLAIRAGLAKTGAKDPKSAFRKRSTAEHWYTAALADLIDAGRTGKLRGAVTGLPSGAERTGFDQWATAELRFASRNNAAGAYGREAAWTQIEFDSSRIRSLFPGKRGPKHAFVRARLGSDAEQEAPATDAARLELWNRYELHKYLIEQMRQGVIPPNPVAFLRRAAKRYGVKSFDRARRIRAAAIAAGKAENLPAAVVWGRRGPKPRHQNPDKTR